MRFALSAWLTMTALSSSANAESASIETAVTPDCEAPARDLELRLGDALGESSPRPLDVSVAIERDGAGYRVALVVRDESSAPREKVLLAPTCEEAVDAAVVVLALATSETDEVSTEPDAPTPPAIAVGRVVDVEPALPPSWSVGPRPQPLSRSRPTFSARPHGCWRPRYGLARAPRTWQRRAAV